MLGASMLDRDSLAATILRELTTRIEHWQRAPGPDPTLVEDYRSRSLTLGSRVRAILPGDREIIGIATHVDEIGRLLHRHRRRRR